jgi:predicted nucleic acid-binding protein
MIKHIQTSIDIVTYDNLRHLSQVQKKSIKETLQEAIKEYLMKHEKKIMDDSFFNIVGSFKTKEGNWSERDDWRE